MISENTVIRSYLDMTTPSKSLSGKNSFTEVPHPNLDTTTVCSPSGQVYLHYHATWYKRQLSVNVANLFGTEGLITKRAQSASSLKILEPVLKNLIKVHFYSK